MCDLLTDKYETNKLLLSTGDFLYFVPPSTTLTQSQVGIFDANVEFIGRSDVLTACPQIVEFLRNVCGEIDFRNSTYPHQLQNHGTVDILLSYWVHTAQNKLVKVLISVIFVWGLILL